MKKNKVNEIIYLSFEQWENEKDLIAVHSTRIGGVSTGYYSSMNLGFASGDDPVLVHENYKRFAESIHVPLEKLVLSDQWHHNTILEVKEEHGGMGIFKERSYGDVDGLFTMEKNMPLVTFYADCTPIYFYDPKIQAIGMAHAGWRGTASKIVLDMLSCFKKHGSNMKDIQVGIGPAVCKSCYQVDQKVIDAMVYDFDIKSYVSYQVEEDRYYIDLKAINKAIILNAGIQEESVEVTHYCTKCHEDLFFSHRRQGNNRGTQIGVMMLKEELNEKL